MLHYGDVRRYPTGQPGPGLAQSTFDVIIGMRGVAVTLLFLDLSTPERPVAEVPGFVEQVETTHLTLGLSAPLPGLTARTRFGVEVMTGPSVLRFRTTASQTPEPGNTRILLNLPHQIESIQRRMFSRVSISASVAFAPMLDGSTNEVTQGGIGQAVDLSAGGLRMSTQQQVQYGQVLLLGFNTPDGNTYRGVAAGVVRVQPAGDRFMVALQFRDLPRAVENQLVQTVFRLQLRGSAK